jgi:uncharacterized membrane protein YagU involved in acid resistance
MVCIFCISFDYYYRISLWKQNIIGVVVLFLFLEHIFIIVLFLKPNYFSLKIEKDHLIINNKIYLRGIFKAYSLEIEKKTQKIRNLVLITEK